MKVKMDIYKMGYYFVQANYSVTADIVARMLNNTWNKKELFRFMRRNGLVKKDGFAKRKFEPYMELFYGFTLRGHYTDEEICEYDYLIKPEGIQILIEYYENELENEANANALNLKDNGSQNSNG